MTRILIVEDETLIRRSLCKLLERNGYAVREAHTVQEAMTEITMTDFSLIISDLRLPGRPGSDLINLPGYNIPVIVITSYANLRSAVEIMRMGAVDYIAKPFDHNEILEAVARVDPERSKESRRFQTLDHTPGQDYGTAHHNIPRDSSLESYFIRYVLENQAVMSETQLADNLGISRKSLWEKRRKHGITRGRSRSEQ